MSGAPAVLNIADHGYGSAAAIDLHSIMVPADAYDADKELLYGLTIPRTPNEAYTQLRLYASTLSNQRTPFTGHPSHPGMFFRGTSVIFESESGVEATFGFGDALIDGLKKIYRNAIDAHSVSDTNKSKALSAWTQFVTESHLLLDELATKAKSPPEEIEVSATADDAGSLREVSAFLAADKRLRTCSTTAAEKSAPMIVNADIAKCMSKILGAAYTANNIRAAMNYLHERSRHSNPDIQKISDIFHQLYAAIKNDPNRFFTMLAEVATDRRSHQHGPVTIPDGATGENGALVIPQAITTTFAESLAALVTKYSKQPDAEPSLTAFIKKHHVLIERHLLPALNTTFSSSATNIANVLIEMKNRTYIPKVLRPLAEASATWCDDGASEAKKTTAKQTIDLFFATLTETMIANPSNQIGAKPTTDKNFSDTDKAEFAGILSKAWLEFGNKPEPDAEEYPEGNGLPKRRVTIPRHAGKAQQSARKPAM